MAKRKWEREVGEVLSSKLQKSDIHHALVDELAQNVLNYFNHRENIAYGLTLDLMKDENRLFSVSALFAFSDQIEDLRMQLEEEQDVFDSEFKDVVEAGFSKWLSNSWPEVVEARLAKEKSFSRVSDFVALRRFMVLAKKADIQFYTKDSDGSGPDLIAGVVVTDVVHSDYEDMASIEENYSSRGLEDVMKGSQDGVMFANWNEAITDAKNGLEFFGPTYPSPFYKYIKSRKEAFSIALKELAQAVSLPLELDLKFKPNSDRIVFNVAWERNLPECFYKISKHNSRNRMQ